MMYVLIAIVLVVVALVLLAMSKKGNPQSTSKEETALPAEPQHADQYSAPTSQSAASRTVVTPVVPPVTSAPEADVLSQFKPVGTPRLDDAENLERPFIDSAVIQRTKAMIPSVPEAVLADALLDTTPQQAKALLSHAPDSVIQEAFGNRTVQTQHHKTEDLNQLKGMGDALDDLDIWSFGDKN